MIRNNLVELDSIEKKISEELKNTVLNFAPEWNSGLRAKLMNLNLSENGIREAKLESLVDSLGKNKSLNERGPIADFRVEASKLLNRHARR